MPFSANTAYVNTIPADQEERCPGNLEIEERLRAFMRWNAMAMVVRANRLHPDDGGDLGGHIGSLRLAGDHAGRRLQPLLARRRAKACTAATCSTSRATSSPGIYARAYLEGRLTEDQLNNFRQEVDGKGLSSYPHPKLMPEFWQFPTVSMGLGPLMAIYQARFLEVPARPRHRQHREPQGLGVLRRRRDGRARNRWAPSAWPRARSWTT